VPILLCCHLRITAHELLKLGWLLWNNDVPWSKMTKLAYWGRAISSIYSISYGALVYCVWCGCHKKTSADSVFTGLAKEQVLACKSCIPKFILGHICRSISKVSQRSVFVLTLYIVSVFCFSVFYWSLSYHCLVAQSQWLFISESEAIWLVSQNKCITKISWSSLSLTAEQKMQWQS